MSYGFYTDAENKSKRRIRHWYQENLMPALIANKEKHVREIDASIALTKEMLAILDEKAAVPAVIPPHEVESRGDDDSLMCPIEPEILNMLYGSTEKGAAEAYLKARYKKAPEDKFYFRIATSWDYGWQQKQSRLRARDINRGRCAILRDTFYRKNNLAPDPKHYSQPSGGEFSICSEYSCNFN